MYFSTLSFTAINLLLASVASAAPQNYTPLDSIDVEIVAEAIRSRANDGKNYRGGQLPSCSGDDNDPSYAKAQTKFKDGEGKYITWDCNKKSSGNGGKQECWTEYWLVNSVVHYDDWEVAGTAIDCASTSTCSNIQAQLKQECKSNGWYAGGSVAGAIEAKFSEIISGGITLEGNGGANGETNACVTESSSATCTWTDKACHTVWKASRRLQVFGYMRRRCRFHTENTQIKKDDQKYDSTGRGFGSYTVGISGFDFDLPEINPIIGCNGLCGQTKYPDPTPADEPFQPVP